MRIFSLFQLCLVVFTIYAVVKFEGGLRIYVPFLALATVFIFEKLQTELKNKKEPVAEVEIVKSIRDIGKSGTGTVASA